MNTVAKGLLSVVRVLSWPLRAAVTRPQSHPNLDSLFRKIRHLERDLRSTRDAADAAMKRANAAYMAASRAKAEKETTAEALPSEPVATPTDGIRAGTSLRHLITRRS